MRKSLIRRCRRLDQWLRGRLGDRTKTLYIDFPPEPKPRYGFGRPPHAALHDLMAARRARYAAILADCQAFTEGLRGIAATAAGDSDAPCWDNAYFAGTNAVLLYCLAARRQPKRYVEVGSGNSTRFMRYAIGQEGLATEIVSIDPSPRAAVKNISDRVIAERLEDLDLALFDELSGGDFLFMDGSHRCFQNSDATVFFLEILPRLAPGVLVYIDDVFLPYDYPPEWADRWYSEQYLLAATLLADRGRRYEIVFPHAFVSADEELGAAERRLWAAIGHPGSGGNGLWLTIKE